MVLPTRFVGGIFGDSKEEKQWLAEINSKGWTDEKGEPENFSKWCGKHGLDQVSTDGKNFAWNKSWFNPLEYVTAPGEHDTRRSVLSLLLSFSHERPSSDLNTLMKDRLYINPLSVRKAIIDYWYVTGIIVDTGNGSIQAGPTLLSNLGNIEDIIMGSSRPIAVKTVHEAFGDSSAPIPDKKGRIIKHGVVIDMTALELNEDWLYEQVRVVGPVIDLMGLAKSEPLQLDQIDDISLSDESILDIVRSVSDQLSDMFPDAVIENDQTLMRVGNSKEVADAFIRKLETIKDQVSSEVEEKKSRQAVLNNLRRSEEQVRRRERLESRNSDSDERNLAIKGAVLKRLEASLMEKGI